MDDKNKISDFVRKRLENFDQNVEDWERPDSSIRDAILNQETSTPKSFFSSIKPYHIAAILLVSILGITSLLYLNNQQKSQSKLEAIYTQLDKKNMEIESLKQEVISLQNSAKGSNKIKSNEFTSHYPSNSPTLSQNTISKNENRNKKTLQEKILVTNSTKENNLYANTDITENRLSKQTPSNNIDRQNEANSRYNKTKINTLPPNTPKRFTLNDQALGTQDLVSFFEIPKNTITHSYEVPYIALEPEKSVNRKKRNLFIGLGMQFKPRPIQTEHRINKKLKGEKPPIKTKLFLNKYIEGEYMLADRIGMYTGFGTGQAKMTKKSTFNYEFDDKNTVINSNGEQYNEIEYRSSSNLGENEALVSFEVPTGVQNADKINVTLKNTFTIKSYNIPLGLSYYFNLNNKWSSYIKSGFNYENIYINKFNLEANVAYKTKEVTSKHLLKQPSSKNIQHLDYNIGIGAAYALNPSWSIQGNVEWNKNIFNNGKKHPPKHFDVDAKVGIYYKI